MIDKELDNLNLKKLFEDQKKFLEENKDSEGTWKSVRSTENFNVINQIFPWGARNIAVPKEKKNNYFLQRSRSYELGNTESEEDIKQELFEKIEELYQIDKIRIDELDNVLKDHKLKPEHVFEIGFRLPKIQNYYKKRGMCESGIDINDSNVSIGKSLGFNCEVHDLNTHQDFNKNINFKEIDLVVCYHVLEHLSNPYEGLKKIYDNVKKGCIFHVEIPIEPDGPRIWYGHLYSFHPHDLAKMIKMLGGVILYATNKTSTEPQGPWIERYTFIKN